MVRSIATTVGNNWLLILGRLFTKNSSITLMKKFYQENRNYPIKPNKISNQVHAITSSQKIFPLCHSSVSSLQTKETQMRLTLLDSPYKRDGSRKLWEFTRESHPGEVHCILGDKERKVIRIFYDLVKYFSKNRHTGYLIFHKPHARQNFYLLNNNIAQSQPLHSFEDVLHEIKRLVLSREKPVLFIKDYFEIVIRSKYWTEKKDDAFKAAYVMLKEMAEK